MKIILSADDFGRSHEMNLAIDHAMRNRLVRSTALLMGSEFTREAVEMAFEGGYIKDVHCHLNLASGVNVGDHFVPQSDAYKASRFCRDGEFLNAKYYRPDFFRYIDVTYKELEAQFLAFRELTKNQANYLHLDFHRYLNLSLPAAYAYDRLIKNYGVRSARFFGEHQKEVKENWKLRLIHAALMRRWRRSGAYRARSSRIEYYLARKEQFENAAYTELFVHPNYRDGVLLDYTKPVFGTEMKPLEEHIGLVRQSRGDIEFISWASLDQPDRPDHPDRPDRPDQQGDGSK